MRIYRNILAIAVTLCALVSCQKAEEWKPGEVIDGPEVFFPLSTPSSINLSSQETSFDLEIYRAKADGAVTAALLASGDTEFFEVPSSVSFGSGEKHTVLTIGYDPDAIGFDSKKSLNISFTDASQTTPYGICDLQLSLVIPSPWTLLGTGTITDNYWFEETRKVKIYQNDLDKNLFKLDSPFVAGNQPTLRVLQPGEIYKGVTITMEDLVGYDDIDLELYATYSDELYMVFPGRFTSKANETLWLHNKVLAYQENGLPGKVQLAPMYYMFNTGGWDKTQDDGMVEIIFPGYVILDCSIEAEYAGLFTNVSGNVSVSAAITLGEDVEEALVALVEGRDAETAAAAIAAGEIPAESVSESGEVLLPIPEDAEFGEYSIVAVSFNGGAAQEVGYSTFQYFGSSPADNLKSGDYTFGEENVLSITPAGNYEYLVEGLGVEDESVWWAYFDPIKNTFNVTGLEYGYEDQGNEFGSPYGMWDDSSVYAYCNYASEESEGDDPLVFNVDPTTHQLASVATNFAIEVHEYAPGYPFIETVFEVAAGTPCQLVVDEEEPVEGAQFSAKVSLHKEAAHPALRDTDSLVKSGSLKFGFQKKGNEPMVIVK